MAIMLNGREEAARIKEYLKEKIVKLGSRGVTPKLVSFYLPADEGSVLYTKIKKKVAEEIGVIFEGVEISNPSITAENIIKLNKDKLVHGILVQKPSGKHNFSEDDWKKMVSQISKDKDVDGLSPGNLDLIKAGKMCFLPATVKAVLKLINLTEVSLDMKEILIIGNTDILGKPLFMYLIGKNFLVTVADKHTKNLENKTKKADLLISATGVAGLIKKEMVKNGAIVIDVGEPVGDAERDVNEVAAFVSPVPGGVGPLTVVSLLENTVEAASITLLE